MRAYWILIILATLVALGLTMVVQSQYQMENIMNKKTEMLKTALETLSNEFLSQDLFKVSTEKVWQNSKKAVEELDAAINKLTAEMAQKKTKNDECQGQMKTTKEELERIKKSHEETKVSLAAEAEAWTKQIKTLKASLTQASPICRYMKKEAEAEKLCLQTNSSLIKKEASN